MNRTLAPYIVLCLLVVFAYSNALPNGFLWDDHFLISSNPVMNLPLSEVPSVLTRPLWQFTGLTDAPQVYHRPMVSLLFLANYRVWGLNPLGYHLANLFLHLAVVLFLYRIGMLLFTGEHARLQALLAASIFAIHPVHNEPAGRAASGEVIFGFFIALSFYAFLRSRWLLSWTAFAFSLLSKEAAVMLPFALAPLCYDRQARGRGLAKLLPYAVIGGAYILLRIMVTDIVLGIQTGRPVLTHAFTMAAASFEYLRLFLFPHPLQAFYPARWYTSVAEPKVVLALAVLAAVAVFAIRLRRDRTTLFLLLSPLVMLAPVIYRVNTFPVRQETAFIAERFLYVPALFFSLLVAVAAAPLLAQERSRRIIVIVWVMLIVVLGGVTVSANGMWRDDSTLFRSIIASSPGTAFAHNNLGVSYRKTGRLDEAIREYALALKIDPNYIDARNNLGVAYEMQGRLDEAVREYSAVLQARPDHAAAHSNLGNVYRKQGDLGKAVQEYRIAIVINPNYADAYNNLGAAYEMQGDLEKAMKEYKMALQINSNLADVHNNLGAIYAKKGRREEAIREFQKTLEIDPNHDRARHNLDILAPNRMDH